jgi:3-deoxy-manno-octulosonate cytidylyltransferase (CMP-KDO synthetase)
MKIIGIIPARYQSTRFPAKVLADIKGKSMIQRVYERSKLSNYLDDVIIATDDTRVEDHVKEFGGKVIMTSESHPSGTDRCKEAVFALREVPDYVVNIQGDEPTIDPDQIDALCSVLNGTVQIATMIKRVKEVSELQDPGEAKVVLDKDGNAIYFSRSPIPFVRESNESEWIHKHDFFKHVGMYAYRTDVLHSIADLSPTALEVAESLEQLRWIEHGYKIKTIETSIDTFCVETPEDLDELINSGLVI